MKIPFSATLGISFAGRMAAGRVDAWIFNTPLCEREMSRELKTRQHFDNSSASPAPRFFLSARRRVIRNSARRIPVFDAIWPRAYVAYSIQGITNGQSPAADRHHRGAKSNGDTRDTRLFPSASFSTPKRARLIVITISLVCIFLL